MRKDGNKVGLLLAVLLVLGALPVYAMRPDPSGTTVKAPITGLKSGATVKAGQNFSCQVQVATGPNTFSFYQIHMAYISIKNSTTSAALLCNPQKLYDGAMFANQTYIRNTTGTVPNVPPGQYTLSFICKTSWYLLGSNKIRFVWLWAKGVNPRHGRQVNSGPSAACLARP